MTTKIKTEETSEQAVIEAAGEVVTLTLVQPSDVAGSPASEAARLDRVSVVT